MCTEELGYHINLSSTDTLNLATAIAENALVFVTLDDTFIGNKRIESAFKIKIKHPGEL